MNADTARAAIAAIAVASENLGQAIKKEQELEDGRSIEKKAAIKRLMQETNDETLKPHSASSAEKIVETDYVYAQYRKVQSEHVLEVQRAWGAFHAAKLTAELEVALVQNGVPTYAGEST